MAELDEILSGEESGPVAEQPRDEKGRFAPVESTVEPVTPEPAAPPAAPEPVTAPVEVKPPEPDHVPTAALLDERRKRQQIERELAEIRQRLEKPSEPEKDIWEDPAAYVSAAEQRAVQKAQEMMRHQFANMSEAAARQRHPDYDEKRAVLEARLESDPVLRSELNRTIDNGGDLGEFVYKTASRLQEIESVGNLDSYRQKLEADIRAKVMAELAQKPQVPQSLNSTSSPSSHTETWGGPPPLDEILKRK